MALVSYSDSEGSENEQQAGSKEAQSTKPDTPSVRSVSKAEFSIDKTNPRKIRVNLPTTSLVSEDSDGPSAAQRPRVGASGFTGFNAMLPPPQKEQTAICGNGVKRKVFSLKTSAEPAFSRDFDIDYNEPYSDDPPESEPALFVPPHSLAEPTAGPPVGNIMRFRPLSVARNTKKPKLVTTPKAAASLSNLQSKVPSTLESSTSQITKPKVSLFSTSIEDPVEDLTSMEQADCAAADPEDANDATRPFQEVLASDRQPDQSLQEIASDLNLSASAKRQLFGRGAKSGTAVNIVNFNTDAEYAANEQLRATGEQIQHNPLRGIAPGKHSLKQLMNSATLQKEALEESFAAGRRNKKEAGNKYGW